MAFVTPTFTQLSTIGRRILVASLRGADSSPAVLLAAAALPVLLAAWALMSPPTMLSTAMTADLLFNLAGAWHIYSGDVPHVDFHDAVGPLNFILTAIGFHLMVHVFASGQRWNVDNLFAAYFWPPCDAFLSARSLHMFFATALCLNVVRDRTSTRLRCPTTAIVGAPTAS
jgi:hypothetical protein